MSLQNPFLLVMTSEHKAFISLPELQSHQAHRRIATSLVLMRNSPDKTTEDSQTSICRRISSQAQKGLRSFQIRPSNPSLPEHALSEALLQPRCIVQDDLPGIEHSVGMAGNQPVRSVVVTSDIRPSPRGGGGFLGCFKRLE